MHVMGFLQCLRLERMILEQLVVMPMAVHVCVRLAQRMTERVILWNTKATICIDLAQLVSIIVFCQQKTIILPFY